MTVGCNHYFMYLTVKFIFTQQAREQHFSSQSCLIAHSYGFKAACQN